MVESELEHLAVDGQARTRRVNPKRTQPEAFDHARATNLNPHRVQLRVLSRPQPG